MTRRSAALLVFATIWSVEAQPQTKPGEQEILAKVASIHGAAGVFAVAGYRIGQNALERLDQKRGSFALDVTHKTPLQVQWSCIADGVQAATGVSAGKLNLHVVEVTPDRLETVIQDKGSGRTLRYRIQPAFLKRFLDTPMEQQAAKARETLKLADAEIFSVEEIAKKP
jgi:formylmethanofuran dehydrogenase subunit E